MDRIWDLGRWRRQQPPACQSMSLVKTRGNQGVLIGHPLSLRSVQWTYLKNTRCKPILCHSVSPDLGFRGSTLSSYIGIFSRCSLESELLLGFSYIGNVLLKGVLIRRPLQIGEHQKSLDALLIHLVD